MQAAGLRPEKYPPPFAVAVEFLALVTGGNSAFGYRLPHLLALT